MDLFRAVPSSAVARGSVPQGRQDSVRLPSNLPFFIDNLLEMWRPSTMPSRRHAVYASPTPELALANASSGAEGEGYVAMRLVITGEAKVAQLQVTDARYHGDIRRLTRVVQQHSEFLTSLDRAAKAEHFGPLFIPGTSKAEMFDWFQAAQTKGIPELTEFADELMKACTFWRDAVAEPVDAPGELFFELMPGAEYVLMPL